MESGGEKSRIFLRDGGANVQEISQLPLISAENAASSQLISVNMDGDDNAKGSEALGSSSCKGSLPPSSVLSSRSFV